MSKTVYYIHSYKSWFYWIAESSSDNKKIPLRPHGPYDILDNPDYNEIIDINIISEKDCRIYLTNKYPNLPLKKTYFYHEGPEKSKHHVERKHNMKDKYKNKQMINSINAFKKGII